METTRGVRSLSEYASFRGLMPPKTGLRSVTIPMNRHVILCLALCVAMSSGLAVRAQEMMGTMFGPPTRRPSGGAEVVARTFDTANVDVQKAKLDFVATELSANYAMPTRSGGDWSVGLGSAHYRIDTAAVLPQSGVAIPKDIWDIKLGAGYRHHFQNRRSAGLLLGVHSPSDRPFNSIDETVIDATAFYRVPAKDRNSWVFFLNYGNRRSFLNHVPLPGMAYAYAPSRETFALIGLPVAMARTRFRDDWSLDIFYFPPVRGRVTLAYALSPRLSPYVTVRSYRDAFLLADRSDPDEWLRHEIIEGDLGLKWQATERLSLDAHIGYAFDRKVYQSDSFGDDDDGLDLDSGVAFRLAARVKM